MRTRHNKGRTVTQHGTPTLVNNVSLIYRRMPRRRSSAEASCVGGCVTSAQMGGGRATAARGEGVGRGRQKSTVVTPLSDNRHTIHQHPKPHTYTHKHSRRRLDECLQGARRPLSVRKLTVCLCKLVEADAANQQIQATMCATNVIRPAPRVHVSANSQTCHAPNCDSGPTGEVGNTDNVGNNDSRVHGNLVKGRMSPDNQSPLPPAATASRRVYTSKSICKSGTTLVTNRNSRGLESRC